MTPPEERNKQEAAISHWRKKHGNAKNRIEQLTGELKELTKIKRNILYKIFHYLKLM